MTTVIHTAPEYDPRLLFLAVAIAIGILVFPVLAGRG